jgi:glucan 1,3-beta-glucosidase
MQAFGHIQAVSGSTDKIELWVGETGWPTQGNKYEAAEPSLDNAKSYYHSAVCGIVDWGFNVFAFEAFDESWKPDSIGQNGVAASEKHWGVMTDDRKPKFSLRC